MPCQIPTLWLGGWPKLPSQGVSIWWARNETQHLKFSSFKEATVNIYIFFYINNGLLVYERGHSWQWTHRELSLDSTVPISSTDLYDIISANCFGFPAVYCFGSNSPLSLLYYWSSRQSATISDLLVNTLRLKSQIFYSEDGRGQKPKVSEYWTQLDRNKLQTNANIAPCLLDV